MAENCKYAGQPILFTEFGGIALRETEGDGNWGYNSGAADETEFLSRYADLLRGVYAADFQGFCYTQLTDVQQEVNGLLYADRKRKFDTAKIKEITQGNK